MNNRKELYFLQTGPWRHLGIQDPHRLGKAEIRARCLQGPVCLI